MQRKRRTIEHTMRSAEKDAQHNTQTSLLRQSLRDAFGANQDSHNLFQYLS